MEEEKGNNDNTKEDDNGRGRHPHKAAAQGQAVLSESIDSNGSEHSFWAVPGSDGEEDLIQNAANEYINKNEDEPDHEQVTEPLEEQDPSMEFEEDIQRYIADIEAGKVNSNILAKGQGVKQDDNKYKQKWE
jgi:hypothetical protein